MKKKNLLLTAGLIALMGTCALSGCGRGDAGASDDKDGNGYADEIYLYNWSEYMTPEVLDLFEQEYGIKVVETTFESNDELLAKLIAGKPGEYDIAVPTNTYITAFRENDLLEPFDKEALTNLSNIDEAFLGLDYDPNNEYCVPYMGTISVVLANKPMVEELGVTVETAQDLLNPALSNNILIFDDVEGDITLGLQGAGKEVTTTNLDDLDGAKDYLLQLNANLKSFSQIADERISMARGEVALAYIYSGDALQAMQENENLEVVMKKEQFPLTLDNFVLLKGSKHKKEAQLFIDFLMRPEIAEKLTEEFQYVCFNKAAYELLPDYLKNSEICVLTDDIKNNLVVVNDKEGEMLNKMVSVVTDVKSAK
ncbi:MAG: spermidine/putrescine ABC transporter substrate-binding protein [Lachnospiraceae bacterium]|nr:spermidine/putrescine ABC transporter substrate-binding protein [Lachnospiraceae bacterium]